MKRIIKIGNGSIVIIFLIILLLVNLSLASISLAQEKIVLKYGHVLPAGHSLHKIGEWVKEELNKRTNGRVELKIYPSSTLGSESEMIEGAKMGTIDICMGGMIGNWVPRAHITDLPYVIDTTENFKKFFLNPGTAGKILAEEVLEKTDLRIVGYFALGPKLTLCKNKPILKLEDLKGVKMRVIKTEMVVDTFKAWGCVPIPMAFSEVYTSLKTGVIEGVDDSPASTMGAMGFCEVAPYIVHTGHGFLLIPIVMSEKVLESLPQEIQQILLDVWEEAEYVMVDELMKKDIEEGYKQMRALAIAETWPDLEPFKKAVEPVVKKYVEQLGAEDLLEVMESLR